MPRPRRPSLPVLVVTLGASAVALAVLAAQGSRPGPAPTSTAPTSTAPTSTAPAAVAPEPVPYDDPATQALVELVHEASKLMTARGDAAFEELRRADSPWRRGEQYIFVLDDAGNMLVHPDPKLEGTNALALSDVQGKPIVRGLLDAALATPQRPAGWYHYEWPVPGGLLPRWKSSYVMRSVTPTGAVRVVGAGVYNDRMERAFVVDLVRDAAARVQRDKDATYAVLRDRKGPFLAKDEYVFVLDDEGTALVHPAFPQLEGKNLMDMKDTQGVSFVRAMYDVVEAKGAGWVNYLWPKPGESVSTQKATYVERVPVGDSWVLVGSGVYLADAPRVAPVAPKMTATELVSLVRDAAKLLERRGDGAYGELRRPGSRWLHDDTYFFVWDLEGNRILHAAEPALEGTSGRDAQDVLGRPYGAMLLDVARLPKGEGWVHYQHPEPGNIFPTWKSTFVKRVRLPDGAQRLVGCGIYNMEMSPAFIVDVVQRAAALVADQGKAAFPELRNPRGPFRFMDTYVFVNTPDGVEVVNPAQPSLEGMNLVDVRDVNGKLVFRTYRDVALRRGSGWVDYAWYRPGKNNVAVKKTTYVQRVRHRGDTYIVGSGYYTDEETADTGAAPKGALPSETRERLRKRESGVR